MEKIYKTIIADDSPTFLKALSLIFSHNKHFEIIDACNNGVELLNSPFLQDSDLVVTDIEMPEMSGIEVAKQLNNLNPKLPIIAITMHTDKVFLRTIAEAGFKGFVYKPNVYKDLFKVINKVLNNQFAFSEYIN